MEAFFIRNIIEWQLTHERSMPWHGTKDPYVIWLSEIILQQTRLQQGIPYFKKFLNNFPDVKSFASASEEKILKLWEGLGYYSRARNMHFTAKYISRELSGIFPDNINDLKKLKGVGDYTAAAISSFAFDLPHAVVDGNVYRVLSRYFAIKTPIDSTEGKKEFAGLAQLLLDKNKPAIYNQAIMNFGADICKPSIPLCDMCTLSNDCLAYKAREVSLYPVKHKKLKVKNRYFTYYIVTEGDKIYLKKRAGKDIWKHLYEFPGIESMDPFDDVCKKQKLTHQTINARFKVADAEIFKQINTDQNNIIKVPLIELNKYPYPKIVSDYLKENFYI